jgi:hypothetical protein
MSETPSSKGLGTPFKKNAGRRGTAVARQYRKRAEYVKTQKFIPASKIAF